MIMKYSLLLFCTLLVISCSEKKSTISNDPEPTSCDCNELILDKSYQRFFLTDKEKPFTGTCITYKADGKKVFERNYLKGKYQGLFIDYHENGKVKSTTEYEKNLMTGAQKKYNKEGELISHTIFLRSKLKEIIK